MLIKDRFGKNISTQNPLTSPNREVQRMCVCHTLQYVYYIHPSNPRYSRIVNLQKTARIRKFGMSATPSCLLTLTNVKRRTSSSLPKTKHHFHFPALNPYRCIRVIRGLFYSQRCSGHKPWSHVSSLSAPPPLASADTCTRVFIAQRVHSVSPLDQLGQ